VADGRSNLYVNRAVCTAATAERTRLRSGSLASSCSWWWSNPYGVRHRAGSGIPDNITLQAARH
jgi:hypothetical protein